MTSVQSGTNQRLAKIAGKDSTYIALSRLIALYVMVASVGLWVAYYVYIQRDFPYEWDVSFFLFAKQDILVTLALLFTCLAIWAIRVSPNTGPYRSVSYYPPDRYVLAAAAVLTFALAYAIFVFAYSAYDMSMDEFMSSFQAQIFLKGRILAPIPAEMLPFNKLIQPDFSYVSPEHNLWGSNYRPVYAMLRAAAEFLLDDALLNPVLSALSVLFVGLIVRRLFPTCKEVVLVAVVILLLSPQFLATGGSGFAFPAHLAFNMLWLLLFLRGTVTGHLAAMVVGVFAIGLHQIHFHAVFAAPFLVALLLGAFPHRWIAAIYAPVYILALLGWSAWPEIAVFLETGDTTVIPRSILEIDYFRNFLEVKSDFSEFDSSSQSLMAVNLSRFVVWLSPAALLLVMFALGGWARLPLVVKLATYGIGLTIAIHWLLMPNQMHGWGYRYLHPVLGNVVILAAAGYVEARRRMNGSAFPTVLVALLAFSAIVLLPWRIAQVNAKTGPRALAQEYLSSLDADYVVIDGYALWFGNDFVRNDPFLTNRPIIISRLSPDISLDDLPFLSGATVINATDEVRKMGISSGGLLEPSR